MKIAFQIILLFIFAPDIISSKSGGSGEVTNEFPSNYSNAPLQLEEITHIRQIFKSLLLNYAPPQSSNAWIDSKVDEFWSPIPCPMKDPKCCQDLAAWIDALRNGNERAMTLIDAWGEVPSGASQAQQEFPGNFDDCIYTGYTTSDALPKTDDLGFHGKYCAVYYSDNSVKNGNVSIPFYEMRTRLGVLSGRDLISNVSFNNYGICLPNSCSKAEIENWVNSVFSTGRRFTLRSLTCQTGEEEEEEKTDILSHKGFLIYIFVTVCLMGLATRQDLALDATHATGYSGKFIYAFSPLRNIQQIFRTEKGKQPHSLNCLHGIRVTSTFIVILCHQYGLIRHSDNPWKFYGTKQNASYVLCALVSIASLSVDTFLLMSGLLASLSALREWKTSNQFRVFRFCIVRFLRLTPTILVNCWLFGTVVPNMVITKGPWAPEFQDIARACREYYWKEMFHVVNFFYQTTTTFQDSYPVCNPQTWSVAVDFQLHLCAPLLLLPLLKRPNTGKVLLVIVSVMAIMIPFITIYMNELPPSPILNLSFEKNYIYYSKVYVKPWNRSGPWIVGVCAGFLLSPSKREIKMKKITVGALWFSSIVAMFVIVKKLILLNSHDELYLEEKRLQNALFGALHRPIWALAVAWIIFACYNGYGGWINDALSHRSFHPFSRLTYSAFLLSLNVQMIISSSYKRIFVESHVHRIKESVLAFGFSSFGALLLCLLVEYPASNLVANFVKSGDKENVGTGRQRDKINISKKSQ